MKGFLVLLVLSAAGLAGVFYFRRSLHAPVPGPAVVAPAKQAKERPRRRRHGARRLARNTVSDAPPVPSAPGEAPSGEPPPGVFAPRDDEPPPMIPGGAAVSEAAPNDVFGPDGPSPSGAPSGGRRQPVVVEPPPVKLRAADVKMVWQGEDLSRTETMRLDMSSDGGHDLTDAEIDAKFRTKEEAVLACIARSRPNESTDVPGRVTVKFRIQRTGTVKGVQVEAPVILHKGGLTGCIKNVVGSLRFSTSNNGQVVSFPFSLM